MLHKASLFFCLFLMASLLGSAQKKQPVVYVNTLMGSDSEHQLSAGNTYPSIGA